jgi:predicted transglutaminase-like cysteine proteinase
MGTNVTGIKEKLQRIHTETLKRFVYVSDSIKWGEREHWESPNELPLEGNFSGDCDAFALMCRKLCRLQDIENRLVFCRVEDGITCHLVCESYGYILDNRSDEIKPISEVNYDWLYISGYNQGDPWHMITKGLT